MNVTNKQSSFSKKYNNSSGKNSVGMNSPSPISGAQQSTYISTNSAESLSPRPCSLEDEIIEGFGEPNDVENSNFLEGVCYLKTKTDRFKEHWAVLQGNEIFCYRTA